MKHKIITIPVTVLALFFGLLVSAVVLASPASAGDGSGPAKGEKVVSRTQVFPKHITGPDNKPCTTEVCALSYTIRTGGSGAWGELVITWDGYQNRAYMYRKGGAYNVRDWTYVEISRPIWGGVAADGGYFYKYAGPVGSGPSGGHCIYARGSLVTNGETLSADFYGACG